MHSWVAFYRLIQVSHILYKSSIIYIRKPISGSPHRSYATPWGYGLWPNVVQPLGDFTLVAPIPARSPKSPPCSPPVSRPLATNAAPPS